MATEKEVEIAEELISEQQETTTPAAVSTEEVAPAPASTGAEATLAAEALAESEETLVPLGALTGLRERKNEVIAAKDQLIERLQGELASRETPESTAAVLSPAQKYIADHKDDFDPEMEALPASVHLAQSEWETEQRKAASQKAEVEARKTKGQELYNQAKGQISDYDDIVEIGQGYLTPGDKLDISMAEDPAVELYKRCMKRTLDSNTGDATVLRKHLKTKLATKKPKATPKPETKQAEETQTEEETAAAEVPMNPHLAHVYNAMGVSPEEIGV